MSEVIKDKLPELIFGRDCNEDNYEKYDALFHTDEQQYTYSIRTNLNCFGGFICYLNDKYIGMSENFESSRNLCNIHFHNYLLEYNLESAD